MVEIGRSWSDADGLLAGMRDPEGNESAARYLERISDDRKSAGGEPKDGQAPVIRRDPDRSGTHLHDGPTRLN